MPAGCAGTPPACWAPPTCPRWRCSARPSRTSRCASARAMCSWPPTGPRRSRLEGGAAGPAGAAVLLHAAGVRTRLLRLVEQLRAGGRDLRAGFLADRQRGAAGRVPRSGCRSGGSTIRRCASARLVFEPAVDAAVFIRHPRRAAAGAAAAVLCAADQHPQPVRPRPDARCASVAATRRSPRDWQFLALGSRGSVPELDLAGGRTLCPGPGRLCRLRRGAARGGHSAVSDAVAAHQLSGAGDGGLRRAGR